MPRIPKFDDNRLSDRGKPRMVQQRDDKICHLLDAVQFSQRYDRRLVKRSQDTRHSIKRLSILSNIGHATSSSWSPETAAIATLGDRLEQIRHGLRPFRQHRNTRVGAIAVEEPGNGRLDVVYRDQHRVAHYLRG